MHINKRVPYIALIFAILLVEFLYVIKGIRNDCFHATDFSIYQQAIYDIDFFNNLNPYLTIRNIKIFNDHFDPIIFLGSLFTIAFGKTALNLVIFEFIWPLLTIILIWCSTKDSYQYRLKIILLLLLTKGIFTGLQFPIHPSTWSIFPIFLLFKNIETKRSHSLVFSIIFLFLFREVFPFATLFLAIAFYINKKNKKAILTLFLSIIWVIFVYKLRPFLFGPIYNYGQTALSNIFLNPINTFNNFQYKATFKLLYPFIIPYYLIFKNLSFNEIKKTKSFYCLLFVLPLIGLHFLTGNIHFQYGPFLTAPLLAGLFYNERFFLIIKNKKSFFIIIITFLSSSIGTHTKAFNSVFMNKASKCSLNQSAIDSRQKIRELISTIDLTKNTLAATGGVIPSILRENQLIYQIPLFSKRLKIYNYLLVGLNGSGDTFPYNSKDLQSIIKRCTSTSKIIFQDTYFVLFQNVPSSCIFN